MLQNLRDMLSLETNWYANKPSGKVSYDISILKDTDSVNHKHNEIVTIAKMYKVSLNQWFSTFFMQRPVLQPNTT